MKGIATVALVASFTVSLVFLSSSGRAQSSDSKQKLVEDYLAFSTRCAGVTSQQCTADLAQLKQRQKVLHISDDELSKALGGDSRGFR